MALYTDTVMDHFMHPRNVGEIPDADGVGQVGNAKCGDIMKMYLKIKDGVIEDVKFETFGCGSAIASSSMATEMIKDLPASPAKSAKPPAEPEVLLYLAHISLMAARSSILPVPFSAEKGISSASSGRVSVWRIRARFGSISLFFSLSSLLATTMTGQGGIWVCLCQELCRLP